MSNFSDNSISDNIDSSYLSPEEQHIFNWFKEKKRCTVPEVAQELKLELDEAEKTLNNLVDKKILKIVKLPENNIYQLKVAQVQKKKFIETFLKSVEKKIGKVKFSTLIVLTFVSAFLLAPFVFSPLYLPLLRDSNFDLHQLLQGDLYKLITGYIALFFVLLEMILTLRKRGRGWFIKIKIPGSLLLWRSLHIFVGVGLLGITLVHTIGAHGLNFNAIFLWIFFAVSLSALVGTVAELGVVESAQSSFGKGAAQNNFLTQFLPPMSKAKLIRSLRDIWLSSHIFLVNVFFVMLAFHIFLAYYYQ